MAATTADDAPFGSVQLVTNLKNFYVPINKPRKPTKKSPGNSEKPSSPSAPKISRAVKTRRVMWREMFGTHDRKGRIIAFPHGRVQRLMQDALVRRGINLPKADDEDGNNMRISTSAINLINNILTKCAGDLITSAVEHDPNPHPSTGRLTGPGLCFALQNQMKHQFAKPSDFDRILLNTVQYINPKLDSSEKPPKKKRAPRKKAPAEQDQ